MWHLIGRSVGTYLTTSLCAFVCLIVDYTLRALDIIILDACLVIVFVWGIVMLIILIDPFAYLHILTLLVVWLLCSPWHVHSCCCLSCSSWHVWFSWLYIIMIIMEHAILVRYSSRSSYFLFSLCVDLDDIHVLCMTLYCMTSLIPCDCMSCLSMWDTHLSPYLQFPSLVRPYFPWSHIWYETCYFVCSSTELVIRSRV